MIETAAAFAIALAFGGPARMLLALLILYIVMTAFPGARVKAVIL